MVASFLSRRTVLKVLGATAGLAMPGIVRAASAPATIRVGGQGNAAGKPYGLAAIGILRAKNLLEQEFAKDNIKIDWQFPRGTGPAINEAIANGQLDFANYGGLPNIVGRGAGLPTKVLASYGYSPIYVVARKGSGVTDLAGLKSRKVTVSRGTINELSLYRLLTRTGLTENDIQLFDLISTDQVSALQSGDVDVVVAGSNILPLVDQGVAEVVFSSKGKIDPAAQFGSFVVTEDFASAYPDLTKRVVRSYAAAAHYASLEGNRAEVLDLWALTGQPKTTLTRDFAGDDLRDRLTPLLDDFYRSNLKAGVTFALENKLIRKPVDLEGWVDSSYLDAAIADLGLQGFWTAHDANGTKVG